MLAQPALSWIMPWRRQRDSVKMVGWLFLIVSIISASTFNGFAKVLGGSLSPLSLLFVSEILTGFFILMSFGLVPTMGKIIRLPREKLLTLLLIGVLSGVSGPFLWFTGLTMTTAVNATLFGKGEMIFLILLAVMFLNEKFTSAHMAAIATIVMGFLMVILRGFQDGISLQWGDFIVLLASLSYAGGSVLFRKKLSHIEPHIALLARSTIAIATFIIAAPFIDHPFGVELRAFPLVLIPALIGFSFISRFLNSFSFYQALERLPVSTISIFGGLDVIGGTLFAFVYVGESIEWYHILGGGLILLGTVLLQVLGIHSSDKHLELHMKQRHV